MKTEYDINFTDDIMDQDTFLTIKKESKGIYKDRGSKFISFAFPVSDEAEIRQILIRLKKQYHDARHCCFAYKIGTDEPYIRVNDDGEPSGTAGKPILSQIESNNLTNILLAVVRYFGGKLLGTSGLIKAYRSAASDCLSNNEFKEFRIEIVFFIQFPHDMMKVVMRIIKEEALPVLEQYYDMSCRIKLSAGRETFEHIVKRFSGLQLVKINVAKNKLQI